MLSPVRVIGHKEYAAGRKVDPIYVMDWRRARVATFTPRTDPPTPPEDDDMPQLISHFVPAGEEHTYPIPPVESGAAGWGRAWLSLAVDRHGAPPDPSFVRVAVMGENGQPRPLFGTDPVLPIRPGTRPVVQLRKGDQAVVVASLDKTHGVGLLVEYGPR